MNCLAFRRLAYQDPKSTDANFVAHAQSCTDCGRFLREQLKVERLIGQAVGIEESHTLASRILLRHSFEAEAPRKWWSGHLTKLSAAAALIMVVGLAAFIIPLHPKASGLDKTILTLINEAPFALTAKTPVSKQKVTTALAPIGISLSTDIGSITFASRCFVRDKLAGHIVLEGEAGPITVLLIPNQRLLARGRIRGGHWSGFIVPSGLGAIAIVAHPGEPLENVERRIVDAVRWAPDIAAPMPDDSA